MKKLRDNSGWRRETGKFEVDVGSPIAVSYTHLDVYKRQVVVYVSDHSTVVKAEAITGKM